jgi:beta-N-acetylhexosaminidase
MSLGAADDIELAGRAGEQVAFDLRRAGCTLDFAPVLDLALEPKNRVIGTRSFGADPMRVAALGGAFAQGLARGGVLPCYKHFPGHGATAVDSHFALPAIDAGAPMRSRDLVPFAAVARAAPAMMSAHLIAAAFDRENPATLSAAILDDLLRGELGFGGTLVTDCLEMAAIAQNGSLESAVGALAAGADLLPFSHDANLAEAAVAAIETAVSQGRLSLQRLQSAYARVGALRAAAKPPLPLEAFAPHPGVGREIGRRAVTLLRGIAHADPLASAAISFGADAALLAREAPALVEMRASLEPSPDETRVLVERLGERRPILLARRAYRHPAQVDAIAQILEGFPDALVVTLLEPFGLALFAKARHLVAAYGDDVAAIGGLSDVIFGGSMPTGRLPLGPEA